jgi:serine/threonine protein kinase
MMQGFGHHFQSNTFRLQTEEERRKQHEKRMSVAEYAKGYINYFQSRSRMADRHFIAQWLYSAIYELIEAEEQVETLTINLHSKMDLTRKYQDLERVNNELKQKVLEFTAQEQILNEELVQLRKDRDSILEDNEKLRKQISKITNENEGLRNELDVIRNAVGPKLLKCMLSCKEWEEQNKFEKLGRIMKDDERLKRELSKKNNTRKLNELKEKTNELTLIHYELNEKIKKASKKERTELDRRRSENLVELNNFLDSFIKEVRSDLEVLEYDSTALRKVFDSQNIRDIALDTTNILDKFYKELMKSKHKYEKDLQELMSSAELYNKNLEKAQQKMVEIINEGSKQIHEIEDQRTYLEAVLEDYTGIKKNMYAFLQNSEKVRSLVKQYFDIEAKISDLEIEKSQLDSKYLIQKIIKKGEEDDEKIKEAEKGIQEIDDCINKNNQDMQKYKKELRRLEKELRYFSDFGEVWNLLTKNKNQKISLNDYEYIKNLGGRNNNVDLYKNKAGEFVVLKKLFISQDYSKLSGHDLLLSLPRNPLILPVNEIFYINDTAYIEMPYVEGGTLRDWMKNKGSVREIQGLLRLIAQGISFLHHHDVIHCDLKPENVLIKKIGDTLVPVLCDFEFSRYRHGSFTKTTIGGTYDYMSPELLTGEGKPSIAADVWAFGVIMLELFSKGVPLNQVLDQTSNTFKIETEALMEDIKGDHTFIELVQNILKRDTSERYNMDQILNSEFMLKILDESKVKEDKNRIKVLKKYILQLSKEYYQESLEILVSFKEIVPKTLERFLRMNKKDLLKKLFVKFIDEEGIDAGALTTALYFRFFKASIGILFDKLSTESIVFVPKEDDGEKKTIQNYEALGKILFKVIYDQRTIPFYIAPYVIRYLISESVDNIDDFVSIKDLDMLDSEYANNLRFILGQRGVESLNLDFSSFEPGNNTPLNDANKRQYINKSVERKLIGLRINNLNAMRKGFRYIEDFNSHWNLLTEFDIAKLISSEEFMNKDVLIKECIDFIGEFTPDLPERFIEVLRSFNSDELQQFLYFATGQIGLYSTGNDLPLTNPNNNSPYNRHKISIHFNNASQDKLPDVRVCFYLINMPKYDTVELMRTKLLQSIEMSGGMFSNS